MATLKIRKRRGWQLPSWVKEAEWQRWVQQLKLELVSLQGFSAEVALEESELETWAS